MIFALHYATGIGPIYRHSTRESSLNPILTPYLSFQQSTQWKARPMTVVFPARHRLEVQASCKPQAAQHFMTCSWKPYIWSKLHVTQFLFCNSIWLKCRDQSGSRFGTFGGRAEGLFEAQVESSLVQKKMCLWLCSLCGGSPTSKPLAVLWCFMCVLSCRYCLQAIRIYNMGSIILQYYNWLQLCLELLKGLHHLLSTGLSLETATFGTTRPPLRGHSTKWWPYKVPADCHGHRREVREDPGEPKNNWQGWIRMTVSQICKASFLGFGRILRGTPHQAEDLGLGSDERCGFHVLWLLNSLKTRM